MSCSSRRNHTIFQQRVLCEWEALYHFTACPPLCMESSQNRFEEKQVVKMSGENARRLQTTRYRLDRALHLPNFVPQSLSTRKVTKRLQSPTSCHIAFQCSVVCDKQRVKVLLAACLSCKSWFPANILHQIDILMICADSSLGLDDCNSFPVWLFYLEGSSNLSPQQT